VKVAVVRLSLDSTWRGGLSELTILLVNHFRAFECRYGPKIELGVEFYKVERLVEKVKSKEERRVYWCWRGQKPAERPTIKTIRAPRKFLSGIGNWIFLP